MPGASIVSSNNLPSSTRVGPARPIDVCPYASPSHHRWRRHRWAFPVRTPLALHALTPSVAFRLRSSILHTKRVGAAMKCHAKSPLFALWKYVEVARWVGIKSRF